MTGEEDDPSFKETFTEWVEACWFGETDAAEGHLDTLIELPGPAVFAGSLSVLAHLLGAFGPGREAEVAGALAEHLIIGAPDPERRALIGDVVRAAPAGPGAYTALLRRHGAEAATRTVLECASLLAQLVAEREGVVPSSVLGDL